MKRLLLLLAFLACGDAAAFKPGALGGHSGLGRKCGALGNCGGNTYGFPKSAFNFVADGNSIVAGTGAPGLAFPDQLSRVLTATGFTYTMTNVAHSGYTTPQLTALIPSEVDPLWDGTKNNVLLFHEVLNDLGSGCGSHCTGAQAYAHVQTFMQSLARRWYVVLITPGPQASYPISQYDIDRAAFLALVDADPTFGGTVDATYRLDLDTRFGVVGSNADAYYFYDGTHWLKTAHACVTSAILDVLGTKDAVKFAYRPAFMPWPSAAFTTANGSSALAASGGAATDGQTVATWVADSAAVETGNATQGTDANRPTYSASGFGGHPALNYTINKGLVAAAITLGRGTFVVTASPTAVGHILSSNGPPMDRRFYLDEVATGFSSYEYNGSAGSIHTVANGTYVGAAHVASFTFSGTDALQKVHVDGTSKTLTTWSGFSGNATDLIKTGTLLIGNPTISMTGKVGDVYISLIPLSDHERKNLERYLGALRGITVAP